MEIIAGVNAVSRTIQTIKVTIPEQTPRPVKSAHKTAKSLDKDSRLATFAETIQDVQILKDVKGDMKYLFTPLAVDSKGLPKEAGWYQVTREKEVCFASISDNEARALKNTNRWDEVLYVNEGAVNAAIEGRPIALGLGYGGGGWLIGAGDWPNVDARVALVKLFGFRLFLLRLEGFLRKAEN